MTAEAAALPSPPVEPFRSLNALRAAHTDLLREFHKHEEDRLPPEFVDAMRTFIQRGQATGVLLDIDEDRADAQTLLNYWTTVLYGAGIFARPALLNEFNAASARTVVGDISPYVGLRTFYEKENPVFFGRRKLVQRMIEWLGTHRYIGLVGLSGSGKSSLLRAGLLPTLRDGAIPGAEQWRYLEPMVPGIDPLASLAAVTCPEGTAVETWRATLARSGDALVKAFADKPVVLMVDQLEELFTVSEGDDDKRTFVTHLVTLATAPGLRHTVAVTLRSDFEGALVRYPALSDLLSGEAMVRVPPLDPSGLRNAIERPAGRLGVSFEPGLVEELVQQVLGEPAGLPLLQFTLLKLWEHREGTTIPWKAYRTLGNSVREILARSADDSYNSFKLEEDRRTFEQIFKRLASVGLGGEVTSKRLPRSELYLENVARDRVERVLDVVVNAGLLRVTPGPTRDCDQIEVTHEALLRNWPVLADWLSEERERRRKRLQLAAACEWWRSHDENPSGYLTGLRLAEAEEYTDLAPEEQRFVQASRAAADKNRRQWWAYSATAFTAAMLLLAFAAVKTYQVSQADAQVYAAREAAEKAQIEKDRIDRETQDARDDFDNLARDRDDVIRQREEAEKDLLALREQVKSIETALQGAQQTAVEAENKAAKANQYAQTKEDELREAEQQLEQRPLVRIDGGKLMSLPNAWRILEKQTPRIERNAAAVGVMRVTGANGTYQVTGFLVAPDLVATMIIGDAPRPDQITMELGREQPGGIWERLRLPVREIVGVDKQSGVALLRIDPSRAGPLPPPVELDFKAALKPGVPVYVIGYPMGANASRAQQTQGPTTADKRVQPGYVVSAAPDGATFAHDCLTSGGNSGSPVFDVASGRVVGIHWGGAAGPAVGPGLKRAISLSAVRALPFFAQVTARQQTPPVIIDLPQIEPRLEVHHLSAPPSMARRR